jgi:uncharacterized protein (DUF3820 family)
MKMPFGKHKDKELSLVPDSYLQWFYDENKPIVKEIERLLRLMPIERRAEKIETEILFEEYKKRYPGNEPLECFYEELVEKLFPPRNYDIYKTRKGLNEKI